MNTVTSWNIAENRVWFVRLSDAGTAVQVELYLTQADAEGQANLQASGVSIGYGSALQVILTNETGATVPVSLFRDDNSWHLIVSGQNGDATKIYKVKEFVEADEISHAIYKNSALINSRALYEINSSTKAKITRNISLSVHVPTLEVGDIARLNSSRRGVNDLNQVNEFQIIGTTDSLINDALDLDKYIGLKR